MTWREPARPERTRERATNPILACIDGFATAAGVAHRAVRPGSWRRPVRAEFLRVLDVAGPGCLRIVLVVAVIVGLGLVGQALYWLDRLGEGGDIETVIAQVVIRELAVLVVALIIMGGAGLRLLAELLAMRRDGGIHQLDREGVDPFLLLIMPRVLALPVAVFCHATLFIAVAFVTGFFTARAAGVITESFTAFAGRALTSLGDDGAMVLPAKALAIGGAMGVALCNSALSQGQSRTDHGRALARGFGHMLLAVLAANLLLSLSL